MAGKVGWMSRARADGHRGTGRAHRARGDGPSCSSSRLGREGRKSLNSYRQCWQAKPEGAVSLVVVVWWRPSEAEIGGDGGATVSSTFPSDLVSLHPAGPQHPPSRRPVMLSALSRTPVSSVSSRHACRVGRGLSMGVVGGHPVERRQSRAHPSVSPLPSLGPR